MEYHGLRDYRSGRQPAVDPLADLGPARRARWSRNSSSRTNRTWRSWSTRGCRGPRPPTSSARPWSRRSRSPRRSAWRPAATRVVGCCWAGPGPTPGARHGPASVKLLHELLEQLAILPLRQRGGPGRTARRAAPGRAPRGDPDRRLDAAAQSPRGGRAHPAAWRAPPPGASSAASRCSTPSQGDLIPLFQPSTATTQQHLAAPPQQRDPGAAVDARTSGAARPNPRTTTQSPAARADPTARPRTGGPGREQLLHLSRELLPDAHGGDRWP